MSEPDRSQSVNADEAPQSARVAADAHIDQLLKGAIGTGDESAYSFAWLAIQCARIPGAATGLILLRPPAGQTPVLSATWPQHNLDLPELSSVAHRAYSERRTVVGLGRTGPASSPAQSVGLLVGVPLGEGGDPIASTAVALTITGGTTLISPENVTERMRWGAGWLEALSQARQSKELSANVTQAASCLDLVAVVAQQTGLHATAMAIVNNLATQFDCDRVSLGLVKRNGGVRVRAISHSATFKSEARLVDSIASVMEEAIEQSAPVTFPALPETNRVIAMAHRTLAEMAKAPTSSAASVILVDGRGRSVGVVTLERHRAPPIDSKWLQRAEAMAALIGPVVGLHLRNDKLLAGRAIYGLSEAVAKLAGPRRPALRLAVLAVAALAAALLFAQGEHRVTAKSVLEGEVQRAVVAPFDGFVQSAPVRAGDTVKAGTVLAALDDRELVLERQRWRAERDKLVQKQREVHAKHDRTNLVILDSQIRQAEAQLNLAEEKFVRSRLVAPFDGIVTSGDFSQKLGSPVEKGKLLFEVAPLDSYRLIVHVDERDVRYVVVGHRGTVALAGVPWTPLPLVVTKITPVTFAEEGRNSFQIEARLVERTAGLRPGMEGIAKIETGQRSIVWIWTRATLEWVRLAAWKYLP